MSSISRRSFFFGAGAIATAAMVGFNCRQASFLWGDGVHDDTDALSAFFRGERIETVSGIFHDQNTLDGGRFLVTAPLRIERPGMTWANSTLVVRHDGHLVSGPAGLSFDAALRSKKGPPLEAAILTGPKAPFLTNIHIER